MSTRGARYTRREAWACSCAWRARETPSVRSSHYTCAVSSPAGGSSVSAMPRVFVSSTNTSASGSAPVPTEHPKSGWVQQNANEIWTATQKAIDACLGSNLAHGFTSQKLASQRTHESSPARPVTDITLPAGATRPIRAPWQYTFPAQRVAIDDRGEFI